MGKKNGAEKLIGYKRAREGEREGEREREDEDIEADRDNMELNGGIPRFPSLIRNVP